MDRLGITALVLNVSGLAMAAYGFRETWSTYGRGRRFLPEPIRRSGSALRRLFSQGARRTQVTSTVNIGGARAGATT